jgi:hypothetical protein
VLGGKADQRLGVKYVRLHHAVPPWQKRASQASRERLPAGLRDMEEEDHLDTGYAIQAGSASER